MGAIKQRAPGDATEGRAGLVGDPAGGYDRRMNRLLLFVLVLAVVACGERPPNLVVDAGNPPGTAQDAGGEADAGSAADAGPQTTWYEHVLPVVQRSCQGCHVQGGIAPFTLVEYADAKARHHSITEAVVERRMPPWMADEACIDLKHSRRLPQGEVDLIAQWSAQGAPEGDPALAPAPPDGPVGLEWVDVTLDQGGDYTPNPSVSDDYRCFIVSPAPGTTKDVIGYRVIPGTPAQVHHVILFSVPAAEAQKADDDEAGLGWTCYGSTGTPQQNVRMIGGWVPGSDATRVPEGTGVRVTSSNVFVMQVHYNLSAGAPQPDRTTVELQYAKTPVAKPATIFPVTYAGFQIPPQSTGYSAKGTVTLPSQLPQATMYGITPHMHQLGRKIRVRVATTDQCLINVPAWDFHWQQSYEYETPVKVYGGQTLEIECTWDNPGTQPVKWGEGTADEMCLAFLYTTMP
jgi:hypothetical protein